MDRNAYFGKLIQDQLVGLFFDRPLILFIDGRDITKDHQTYHLMTGKFMDAMVKAAESAAGDVPCYIYALLDEVSIVFPNPQKLLQRNEYSYHDEVCGFFLQDFCREFWKTYPEVRFHIKAYNLASSKDIQEFFLWRKERSRHLSRKVRGRAGVVSKRKRPPHIEESLSFRTVCSALIFVVLFLSHHEEYCRSCCHPKGDRKHRNISCRDIIDIVILIILILMKIRDILLCILTDILRLGFGRSGYVIVPLFFLLVT